MVASGVRHVHLPRILKEVGKLFRENGFESYLVGGAVRNRVAGLPGSDFDLATNARPEEVMKIFRRVIPTGIKHGTVTVLFKGQKIEVTTFRSEGSYSDARHPDSVAFIGSIEEDLARRDFTMNALAVNLTNGELLDPHDGRRDVRSRIIRAIGDPTERFNEDGLRLMRACRFAAQLDFSIDDETLAGMRASAERIESVSAERIQDELVKILATKQPSRAFQLMDSSGLLALLFPELEQCKGVEQKGIHEFDVFKHSLLACDGAPADRLDLRLAALFHDLGKPVTYALDKNGMPTFYRHEEESERLTRSILKRLRFSNAIEARVCHLVRQHMFHYEEGWSDSAVRRFLVRVGKENVPDLFLLRRADTFGAAGRYVDDRSLADFSAHIQRVLADESVLTIKDLAVDGNILESEAGIPKGPLMGTVLNELLSSVLDDPSLNTRESLVAIARNFHENHLKKLKREG